MNSTFPWQYNEFKQVGRDYSSQAEVDVYDSSHAKFRDLKAEFNRTFDLLQVKRGSVLIDFGSGTGIFAIQAVQRGIRVYAVDVSRTMIDYAKKKSKETGVNNIEFHHGGFLTYKHPNSSVDAITSTFSFHHLPDLWKGVALKRMNCMLKPGGRLYIHDVILEESAMMENISGLIARQEMAGGPFLREDAEGHFRDEYSTYDWVIDGLLSRAGFDITSKHIESGVIGTYVCIKS